jgi:hypothetical protein
LHNYTPGNGELSGGFPVEAANTKEKEMSMIDPKGTQPEPLAKFAEVSRNDDGQPVKDGIFADRETAAIPTDPKLKQDAATKVLREGVTHRNQGARQAINKLPDRTAKK